MEPPAGLAHPTESLTKPTRQRLRSCRIPHRQVKAWSRLQTKGRQAGQRKGAGAGCTDSAPATTPSVHVCELPRAAALRGARPLKQGCTGAARPGACRLQMARRSSLAIGQGTLPSQPPLPSNRHPSTAPPRPPRPAPPPRHSSMIRDSAWISVLRFRCTPASRLKAPMSADMDSTCSRVRHSVCTLERSAFTLSSVRTAACCV